MEQQGNLDSLRQSPMQIAYAEAWFLDMYHAIGPVGVLVLKSLSYLSKGQDIVVQISRETLARHSGRSIRTVSRAVARLKALQLAEAMQPSPRGFECWECNVYRLTPLGLHLAFLLGSGGKNDDVSARDMGDSPVCKEEFLGDSADKASETPMAHAENIEVFHEQMPAPSLDPELEPVVQELEQADPHRFAHLRDWLRAKLRGKTPRRHVVEALAALSANLDKVRFWAGWVQHRLEDLARAEREAERARERAVRDARDWLEKVRRWEQERAEGWPGGKTLVELIAALSGRPAQLHIAATPT